MHARSQSSGHKNGKSATDMSTGLDRAQIRAHCGGGWAPWCYHSALTSTYTQKVREQAISDLTFTRGAAYHTAWGHLLWGGSAVSTPVTLIGHSRLLVFNKGPMGGSICGSMLLEKYELSPDRFLTVGFGACYAPLDGQFEEGGDSHPIALAALWPTGRQPWAGHHGSSGRSTFTRSEAALGCCPVLKKSEGALCLAPSGRSACGPKPVTVLCRSA